MCSEVAVAFPNHPRFRGLLSNGEWRCAGSESASTSWVKTARSRSYSITARSGQAENSGRGAPLA
jgi:hypothetical protein